jgi:hypothetical protein
LRRAGIAALASLTRLATGYRHITDCQCGFTGVAGSALRVLRPERLYAGYGYPNDLLSRCSANGLRVAEVPVRPRYGVGEHSKMRIPHVVIPILSLLVRALLRRLVRPAVARSVARESVGGR